MKIDLIEPIGFCAGAKKAVEKALNFSDAASKSVVIVGEIVHNEDVKKGFDKRNIINFKIDDNLVNELNSLNNETVIFGAHGHDKKYEEILKNKNLEFIDTTCPVLLMMFERIRRTEKPIIFIGDANHDETKAVLSLNKNIHLFDYKKRVVPIMDNDDCIEVFSQSTLGPNVLDSAIKEIKSKYPNANVNKNLCNAVEKRQEVVRNLNGYDIYLVCGGSNSSNTRSLYEILKEKDNNVFLISNEEDLNKIKFSNESKIALISGTSTPIEVVLKYKELIKNKEVLQGL